MEPAPNDITCPKCGKNVPAARWVCPACGTYIHVLLDNQPLPEIIDEGSLSISIHRLVPDERPVQRHPYIRYLIIILGSLAVLAVVAFLVQRWLHAPRGIQPTAPFAPTVHPLKTPIHKTSTPEIAANEKSAAEQPTPLPTIPSLLPPVDIQPLSGKDLVQLTNSTNRDYSPSLSRDQRRMVYSSEIDGIWQIVEANPNGSGVNRQITSGVANYYTPRFSVDGTQILVVSNWSGNLDIYLISAETGEIIRPLTTDAYNDYAPNWLPDYSGIVFTSQRDGNDEIYMLKLAEAGQEQSEPVRLTDNPSFDGYPSVSTGGEEIAFYSDRDEDYNYEIYVISLATMKPRRLTNNPARDAMPVFSPGDAWILFESNRSGNYEIYGLHLDEEDESNLRNLTNNPAGDYMPVFSPDGFWLLFQSDRSGNMDIYRRSWP
jgi:Tol biopolymer transport system component